MCVCLCKREAYLIKMERARLIVLNKTKKLEKNS